MVDEVKGIENNSKPKKKNKLSPIVEAQISLLKQLNKPQDFIDCFIETGNLIEAEILYNDRLTTKNNNLDNNDLTEKQSVAYLENGETIIINSEYLKEYNIEL
ncbi:MAG: hypothetical protein PUI46_00885 [Lachnospiraceae bacterium]|nr:hypothetical protein [Lachnospiraceae bacterium]MDY5699709.1 hypothetical protein [Lachnospiraceae bacterium]